MLASFFGRFPHANSRPPTACSQKMTSVSSDSSKSGLGVILDLQDSEDGCCDENGRIASCASCVCSSVALPFSCKAVVLCVCVRAWFRKGRGWIAAVCSPLFELSEYLPEGGPCPNVMKMERFPSQFHKGSRTNGTCANACTPSWFSSVLALIGFRRHV